MTDQRPLPPHPLLPPGETSAVQARRVLVLAPHYDDEVLGCGGLLAQLAARGGRVRVLFLSDGAGTAAEGEAPADHAVGRRRESEGALRVLGVGESEHLDLPDGALDRNLGTLAAAIREAVRDLEPDLLLVPSPLEATADHRAAFAALHEVLGPLRGRPSRPPHEEDGLEDGPEDGDDLATAVRDLTILAYEVNHPGYPDLLVDVSAELPLLADAMACYASQQKRHDYLAAGLGLRAFRTLSLVRPREVEPSGEEALAPAGSPKVGAEGYRRLTPADFATRSPAQLIRHLGGAPVLHEVTDGPLVSVIVRTKDRPELLAEALASLAAGTYRRAEVVVVNDGGVPPTLPEDYPLSLVRVDMAEDLGRAAAANEGIRTATGEWIAFLDDDDVAAPEHLATLAGAAAAADVRVVYSDAAVVTYELPAGGPSGGWREAERRLPYSRDFDPELLLVDNYIPFNTILFDRSLLDELDGPRQAEATREAVGPFDPTLPIFEDWDFLIRLATRTPFHHLRRVTCEYRHFRGAGHHALGDRPRERADFLAQKARVIAKHADRLGPERLARVVDRLRAEVVEAGEAAAASRRAATEAERGRAAVEDRYHRLNGEAEALRGEIRALRDAAAQQGEELERLYGEEKVLRETVDDQGEHLSRTYAEIERLNGILSELRRASLAGILRWWRDQRKSGR